MSPFEELDGNKGPDGPYTLAVISNPSALFAHRQEGPWKLCLDRRTKDGVFLDLCSDENVLIRVEIDPVLLSVKVDIPVPEVKKNKNKKTSKRKKIESNPDYNWSDHRSDSILTRRELESSIREADIGKKSKRGRKRKHKKRKDKKDRQGPSRKPKTKTTMTSPSWKAKKRETERIPEADSGGSTDGELSATNAYAVSISSDNCPWNENQVTSLATVPPKHSSSHLAQTSSPASPLTLPSITLSDLRSPLKWERRRQEVLIQAKQLVRVRVSVISLTNPLLSISGYFLATGRQSQGRLEKILEGGAFMYKSSGRERKMIQWEKRLAKKTKAIARKKPHGLEIRPASPPKSASYLQFRPARTSTQIAASCHVSLLEQHLQQQDPMEEHPSIGAEDATVPGGQIEPPYDNGFVNKDAKAQSPQRLNTLKRIQDLESLDAPSDDDDDKEKEGRDIPEQDGREGNSYNHAGWPPPHQTSSMVSNRVTGEDYLWTSRPRRGRGWWNRLREKWTRRRTGSRP